MKIGKEEKKFYDTVYTALEKLGKPIDETTCKKLIARGIEDEAVQDKVYIIKFASHFPDLRHRFEEQNNN
jgi:hypothetical protein